MPSNSKRTRTNRSDRGVMEMVRERPIAAAAAAAGAAATGLFLWSKRAQISNQLSHLSDQIGEWRQGNDDDLPDDTAGPTSPAARGRGRAKRQPTT
jgi:hypothetical protein